MLFNCGGDGGGGGVIYIYSHVMSSFAVLCLQPSVIRCDVCVPVSRLRSACHTEMGLLGCVLLHAPVRTGHWSAGGVIGRHAQ